MYTGEWTSEVFRQGISGGYCPAKYGIKFNSTSGCGKKPQAYFFLKNSLTGTPLKLKCSRSLFSR
jgi:hypothetical protein